MTLLILVFAGTGLAFLGLMVLWALSLMVEPFIGQASAEEIKKVLDDKN